MSRFKVHTGQGDGSTPPGYYRAPAAAKVDPSNEESLELWCKSLEISRSELLEAIKRYGVMVREIRQGLLSEKNKAA